MCGKVENFAGRLSEVCVCVLSPQVSCGTLAGEVLVFDNKFAQWVLEKVTDGKTRVAYPGQRQGMPCLYTVQPDKLARLIGIRRIRSEI